MVDRTIRSKSPWMRLFSISKPIILDDLDKSQIEARIQIKENRSNRRKIVKAIK